MNIVCMLHTQHTQYTHLFIFISWAHYYKQQIIGNRQKKTAKLSRKKLLKHSNENWFIFFLFILELIGKKNILLQNFDILINKKTLWNYRRFIDKNTWMYRGILCTFQLLKRFISFSFSFSLILEFRDAHIDY